MSIKLFVFLFLMVTFSCYSYIVYTKGTESLPSLSSDKELVIKGKLLWQDKNCNACHQIFGLGGYLGPELTNEMSQPGKGKVYAKAILEHGLNRMPDFHLNTDEINSLIAFLQYVDTASRTNYSSISEK
jgi:nitric oxide reductase subunit C